MEWYFESQLHIRSWFRKSFGISDLKSQFRMCCEVLFGLSVKIVEFSALFGTRIHFTFSTLGSTRIDFSSNARWKNNSHCKRFFTSAAQTFRRQQHCQEGKNFSRRTKTLERTKAHFCLIVKLWGQNHQTHNS